LQDVNKKFLLVPAFLLGSLSIYCTETVVMVARQGPGDGGDEALGPVGTAHADPATFSVISEGTFSGQSEVISVEGAARITVAVSTTPQSSEAECHVNWVVPSGKLASASFENALSSLYLPMNNDHSDVVGAIPVVLPKIQIACKNITGPVDYSVFAIK
jgi:hypothetical protein